MAHRLTRIAGIALLLAGVLLAVAGARPEPARMDAQPGGFVNADRPGIDNHNSPAVAVDPTRPSVVAVADRIDSPRFSCTLSLSTNAGATWRPVAVPLPPEAPNCFWPDVAFDGDGRLLLLYTATGGRFNQPLGAWVQRFDGEAASGPPVQVAGTEAFHAHFAVDRRRVVVAYVQTPPENADRPLGFEPGAHPLMVVRSEDGGATFSPPVRVSDGVRVAHPSVVLDGSGTGQVLVGALDYGDDVENYEGLHNGQAGPPPAAHWRVLAWRSTDGGATFGPTTVVADRVVVPQRVVIDLAPGPSFAAAPSGALYAAWEGGTGDARDVFLARSTDGGATWGPAARVGPTERGQFLPAVDVAPDGGRVDVVFYDRSRDPEDVMAHAVVGSSWDGGRTFTTEVASTDPFDSRIGQGGMQGVPQLGNQLAVLSRPGSLLAFWAEATRVSAAVEVQNLAVATATPEEAGGRSWLLVGVGAVLVVAGAALALSSRKSPS